jgi:hypothetical protein
LKRNITLIIMICLIASVALAGCARRDNTPSPSPVVSPMLSPIVSPSPDMSPDMSPDGSPDTPLNPGDNESPGGNGNMGSTGETTNNQEAASAIKAEVDKLSEVEVAHVLVLGNVALVGIEFAEQYQGGMTDRIAEMVTEKARAAVDTIVDVEITEDSEHVSTIKTLAEKAGEEIHQDVADIISKIKDAV